MMTKLSVPKPDASWPVHAHKKALNAHLATVKYRAAAEHRRHEIIVVLQPGLDYVSSLICETDALQRLAGRLESGYARSQAACRSQHREFRLGKVQLESSRPESIRSPFFSSYYGRR